jgi:hypothetical protein
VSFATITLSVASQQVGVVVVVVVYFVINSVWKVLDTPSYLVHIKGLKLIVCSTSWYVAPRHHYSTLIWIPGSPSELHNHSLIFLKMRGSLSASSCSEHDHVTYLPAHKVTPFCTKLIVLYNNHSILFNIKIHERMGGHMDELTSRVNLLQLP